MHLYALFLRLFPRAYREEYGKELLVVFDLSLNDAMQAGKLEVARVMLRELIGLPQAILYEHLRERRKTKMTGKFAPRFDFAPGSRNESFAALAPFLLFGVLPVIVRLLGRYITIPYAVEIVLTLLMIGSLINLFIFGFLKSIPRWFLPYLGLPLPILCVLIFNGWFDSIGGTFDAPWLIRQFISAGLIWGNLILLTVVLVLISALVKKLRPFYQRLRVDWTLLSFMLYGSVPFIVVVGFEGYINNETYLVAVFLILAAGGWLYLQNENSWKKFLSLFGGLTLSMLVAAWGQTALYEISFPNSMFPWWTTTAGTVVAWAWLALIMLMPLALNLLPHPKTDSQAGTPSITSAG